MPDPAYAWRYQRDRARILATHPHCHLCKRAGADTIDHVPAIALHVRPHVHGSGCCRLLPAHRRCNQVDGQRVRWLSINRRRRRRAA